MLNGKNIAWNIYKKEYSNGKTIKLLSNFHSIISGACFTFFIGLFSAGPDSISNSYFFMDGYIRLCHIDIIKYMFLFILYVHE